MLKQLLTGSYVIVLLLAGSLSVQAQVPKPGSPSTKPQAPQPGSPSTQPQVPTAPQAQISQDELQKFAKTLKQLLVIEQGVNQQMAQVVSKSGLSQERFSEILQAEKNPSAQPTTPVTSKEKQQFQKTYTKLGEIQQQGQSKMEQVVKKEGIDPARFNQILVTVKQDPALRQKVQSMIQS